MTSLSLYTKEKTNDEVERQLSTYVSFYINLHSVLLNSNCTNSTFLLIIILPGSGQGISYDLVSIMTGRIIFKLEYTL